MLSVCIMKITFKEKNDGLKNDIYVDDEFIGSVLKEISGKWKLKAGFVIFSSKEKIKKMRFDSFYEAGKYLADLYNKAYNYFDDYQDDTQEIDMRGVFSQRGP